MALTVTWNEANPADSEALAQGDDRIREFKIQMRETWQVDHEFPNSGSAGDATLGYHKAVHLKEQAAPTAVANVGILYVKDVGGNEDLYYRSNTPATDLNLVKNGALALPVGFIGIWSGTIAAIPTGWIICDGNGGTPNLLDRFVRGVATAATNPGTTGGAATYDISHTHTGPSHTHTNPSTSTQATGGQGNATDTGGGTARSEPNHTHTQGDTGASGTGATGSSLSTTQSILPPFYAVAFIYKT